MAKTDTDIPAQLRDYYDKQPAVNLSTNDINRRIDTIALARAEHECWQRLQRPIGTPLTIVLVRYDENGQRYAVADRGEIPVPGGYVDSRLVSGLSAPQTRAHDTVNVYTTDAEYIRRTADSIIENQFSELLRQAEHEYRLEQAYLAKYRDDERARNFPPAPGCPTCGGDTGGIIGRSIATGAISNDGYAGEFISSCLPCWGAAHKRWLDSVSASPRKRALR